MNTIFGDVVNWHDDLLERQRWGHARFANGGQKGAFGFAAFIFLSALFARPLGPDLAAEGQ
jgi:hypothetical protein